MKKTIYVIIGIVVIAAAALAFAPRAEAPAGAGAGAVGTSTTYGMADVVAHASTTSCWTAIDGSVYDLTAWVSRHPGGPEAIEYTCGRDATDAFANQHGGQRDPMRELKAFRIGALAR